MTWLEVAANIASILTAGAAMIATAYYWWDQRRKRIKLENYLKVEHSENSNKRTHTVLHIMANVGLTEDEILRASFQSRHIRRLVHVNRDTNLADNLLFEYQADPN